MKTFYAGFLSALFALAACAGAAQAQSADQLLIKVPYDFVVAGKTLPAGSYRVTRTSDNDMTEMAITGMTNRQSVLFLSTTVDETRDFKPTLTLERVGNQYFLSKIETANHIFTISSPAQIAEIAMKYQNNSSASGSSRAD